MTNEAKVAIVTGAAGGIGEAAARAIARRGARVAVADLRADAAQDAARRLQADGLSAEPVTVDIADPASVNAMVEGVLSRWSASTSWSTTPASKAPSRSSTSASRITSG